MKGVDELPVFTFKVTTNINFHLNLTPKGSILGGIQHLKMIEELALSSFLELFILRPPKPSYLCLFFKLLEKPDVLYSLKSTFIPAN